MRTTAVWLLSVWLCAACAHADDALAKRLFEEGVNAASHENWSEAVRLLEASLQRRDKPACRYNLAVANRELGRPLEVVRHAIEFLAGVEGRSHTEEAHKVRTLLEQAAPDLVILVVQGLPLGTQLRVDGAPPEVTDGSRVYVLPGSHRLELWLNDQQLESIEIQLRAGVSQPWPRVLAHRVSEPHEAIPSTPRLLATSPPSPRSEQRELLQTVPSSKLEPRASMPLLRRRLAWGLGLSGALLSLAALGCYGYTLHRADVLEDWDPLRRGYPAAADRYMRSAASVMPLAFLGGATIAVATAVAEKPRAALAFSIGSFVLGAAAAVLGTVLIARDPRALLEDTPLKRPTREGGSLLLGASLPLFTLGGKIQWELWRERRAAR